MSAIIKITVISVLSWMCMISFHPYKNPRGRYYHLHFLDRGTEAQRGKNVLKIQQLVCNGAWPQSPSLTKWFILLKTSQPKVEVPLKRAVVIFHCFQRWASRRYWWAQRKLPVWKFHLEGLWGGFKGIDLGANCSLCSGVPWVPLTESWGTNLEPQPLPLNQTQKLPPGAQTPAQIGRQFPLGWILVWPNTSLSFIT